MNHEFELKLQAYLDGELDARQARDMEAGLAAKPEAAALLAELKMTVGALRGNELEQELPETREFYWSKIERALEVENRKIVPAGSPSRFGWLFRYWPQLSGAGVAALLLATAMFRFGGLTGANWEDIENPLNDASTFTYRSEQQRMTLVWISSPSQAPDEETDSVN
jgi:anti-sigma factor RsiW